MGEYIKAQKAESKIPEVDLLQALWSAIMADVDWSAKPELLEGLALNSVKVRTARLDFELPHLLRIFYVSRPTLH